MRTQFRLRALSRFLKNDVVIVRHLVDYIVIVGIVGVVATCNRTGTTGSVFGKEVVVVDIVVVVVVVVVIFCSW